MKEEPAAEYRLKKEQVKAVQIWRRSIEAAVEEEYGEKRPEFGPIQLVAHRRQKRKEQIQ